MKKMYLIASALLVGTTVSAQLRETIFDMDEPTPWLGEVVSSHDHISSSTDRAGGDIFYTNTFDNQADWTITPLTGHDTGTWEYGPPTDPGLVPNWMSDINSTTKSDGYYFFSGAQYTVAGTVGTEYTALQTVNPIDCSSRPGVILSLEQSFRAFNSSSVWVGVSTNGTTWTDYEVNTSVQSNSSTSDDLILNISSVAGGQSTVYIRFIWNAGTSGGYGWIIDDLNLIEAYANDISQNNLFTNDIYNGYEYTKVPQVQGTPLTVQAALTNNGYNTPTSVQCHTIVTNSSMGVELDATGGTLSGALAPGDEDTITFITSLDLSTLSTDVYTITNIIEHSVADDVTSNDTLVTMIEVTDNIYSHFNPNSNDLYYSNPGYQSSGSYIGFQYGVDFEMNANADLHGIDFYVHPGNSGSANYVPTSEPQTIGVYLYDATTDFQSPTYIDYREFTLDGYTSGMNTFNFHMADGNSGAVSLTAGTLVRVAIEVLPGFSLWTVGEIPDEDYSSLQYGEFGSGGTTGWFSNSVEVGLNMNFDQSLGIDAPKNTDPFSIGQNYPNPFNNGSVINYSLDQAANVSVTFTDVTGKVVRTINKGTQTAGSYQIELNGNDFAQGVYFYTFKIGDRTVTKRMTVK